MGRPPAPNFRVRDRDFRGRALYILTKTTADLGADPPRTPQKSGTGSENWGRAAPAPGLRKALLSDSRQ